VSLSIGSPKYINDKLGGDSDPQVVNNFYLGEETEGNKVEPGLTFDVSHNSASSSSKQAEDAKKISTKKLTTSESNIGGLPNEDWRAWAASVKEKPMPINYKLVGIWQLLGDKASAYFEALMYLENIDLTPDEPTPLLDLMHFGIVDGKGDPLMPSEMNSDVTSRALLQVGTIPKYRSSISGIPNINENDFIEWNVADDDSDFPWQEDVFQLDEGVSYWLYSCSVIQHQMSLIVSFSF
jgi:hypothetical protein